MTWKLISGPSAGLWRSALVEGSEPTPRFDSTPRRGLGEENDTQVIQRRI
jgi:hypothetical protein